MAIRQPATRIVLVAQLIAAGCSLEPGIEPGDAARGDGGTADTGAGADSSTDARVEADAGRVDGAAPPVCIESPDPTSPLPPIVVCNYMDWSLSSDGYYLVSQFGTTADGTTFGNPTSCGTLQDHYDYYSCQHDMRVDECKGQDYHIPWIQGHVDYDHDTVIAAIDQYRPQAVPYPEYFYVAGAQRFNCGSLLRVTNIANDRCVVVYVEDGGPGATYEDVGYGDRRILDSSPAVTRFLEIQHLGWANSDLVYVEWGQPGDVPGQLCQRCQSQPAAAGYEGGGTPFDVNDMMTLECRPAGCGDGFCACSEDHAGCPQDCSAAVVAATGTTEVDDATTAFKRCGNSSYWHAETAGLGGGLIWTYTTDAAAADNYAVWELSFAAATTCQVDAYTAAAFAHSLQAGYRVHHAGSEDAVVVDQTSHDGWNPIGRFAFAAGGGQWLRLDDNTGEPYADRVSIAFDAIRLTCQN